MNTAAALAIIDRMGAYWPSERWTQARIDAWCEFLAGHDEGRVGTVIVRLSRSLDVAPTIRRVNEELAACDFDDASTRPTECPDCAGSGWTSGHVETHHGREYPVAKPCRCPQGAQAEQTRRRIITANDNTLRHTPRSTAA